MQAQATITFPAELTDLIQTEVRKAVAEATSQRMVEDKTPEFMNLGQAADYLHISRGTLAKLIKTNEIAVTIIGTAKRISKEDARRYMENNKI